MDLYNKKLYIKNNIDRINNNNIIKLIKLNEINYTKNINGIFLDINLLNENHIDKIISIINNEIEFKLNEDINDKNIKEKTINNEKNIEINQKKEVLKNEKNNKNDINFNNFNFKSNEIDIINYSKKYYL